MDSDVPECELTPVPVPIGAHGEWIGTEIEHEHVFDPSLAASITNFIQHEQCMLAQTGASSNMSVVDFGCGLGDYVRYLRLALTPSVDVRGFDGNPCTPALTRELGCGVCDLAVPLPLDAPVYDWVMCLEVGEHIPRDYEATLLANLDRSCRHGIILSWAVENQIGHGHVNCQNNDVIKSKMAQRGYVNDWIAEQHMRCASTLDWFRDTVMIFRKKQTSDCTIRN